VLIQRCIDRIWVWISYVRNAKRADERGIALISVILLIMVLSFVSAAAIVTSTTELKIGSNFRTSVQSFYNAEAGVNYALSQIAAVYPNISGNSKKTVPVSPFTRQYPSPSYPIPSTFSNWTTLTLHYPAPSYPLPNAFSNWTTTHLYRKPGSRTDYLFSVTGYYAANSNTSTSLQVVVDVSGLVKPPPWPTIVSWKQL
jgi:hypothetical protein